MNREQRRAASKSSRRHSKSKMGLSVLAATSLVSGSTALLTALPAYAATCDVNAGGSNADRFNALQNHLNNFCSTINVHESIVLNTDDDDSIFDGYGPWFVPGGADVTIVGVGGSITLDADYESNIFQVAGGASDVTLTLRNLTLIEGNARGGSDGPFDFSFGINGGAIVQETSTDGELYLRLDNVNFYDNFADGRGGAVFIDRGRIAVIGDGETRFGDDDARGNYADIHGGAVYIENGDFVVDDGAELIVDANATGGDGGGINIEFGNFRVYGSAIFGNNFAGDNGGGLHVDNGSIFAEIDAEGYAVRDEDRDRVVFYDNQALGDGGGIYLNSGSLELTSDLDLGVGVPFPQFYFVGNGAGDDGGAIFVGNTSTVKIDSAFAFFGSYFGGPGPDPMAESVLGSAVVGPFIGEGGINQANDDGGAIYIGRGDLEFNNSAAIFVANYALSDGGAIHLGYGDVNFIDTLSFMAGNEAEYDGGAIFVSNGNVNIDSDSDVYFLYNYAENGGAVYIQSGEFISTGSVEFNQNRAEGNFAFGAEPEFEAADMANLSGGAIFISEGNIDISGTSEFTDNDAEGDGGAIAVDRVVSHVRFNGTVFTGNDAESDGGAIHLNYADNAEFTITNATFYQNVAAIDDGGAISVDYFDSGSLTITGSRFKQNFAGTNDGDHGGAIYLNDADDADIVISNSTFMENGASDEGGAIRISYLEFGSLTITSSSFISNEAGEGGAIYLDDAEYAQVAITNSIFNLNEAEIDDGGAIAIDDIEGGTLTVTSSTFTNNEADDDGGAIYINNSDDVIFSVINSTFRNNAAVGDGDGGAIAMDDSDDSTILISGSTFTDNYSAEDGGAIYLEDLDNTTVSFVNSVFTSNTALYDGGAIHFDSDSDNNDVYITGSTFTSNRAIRYDGGAVSTDGDSSYIVISNSTFTSNLAGDQGGAIYFDSSNTDIYIEESVFRGNSAGNASDLYIGSVEESDDEEVDGRVTPADHFGDSGGAIFSYSASSTLYLTGGNVFDNNHAVSGNGGAILAYGIVVTGQNIFIENRADESGGAIFSAYYDANIRDAYFGGNTAGEDGGAIWAWQVDAVNNTFFNNQAGLEGGAIWAVGNLGEGDVVRSKVAMNTFLVNLTGNEGASVGLSIYTAGKINLFGNIFASNDSAQSHLEVGGGEGMPEFIDLGANFFTSSNDTDVLTAASSKLVSFADLTIPQEAKLDTTGDGRTFVVPITTDSLAADAIDTTEFAATLAALNLGGLNTDQRGIARTGKFDAGAFEVGDSTYRKPQIDQQADPVVIAPKVVLPSTPAAVSIKAEGKKAIRINWTAPKTSGTGKVLSYEIYRNGKKIATVSASARTLLDRNLDSRQSYTYRIVTVGSQGKSIKSPNTRAIFPRR